jgi:hypothetical protein
VANSKRKRDTKVQTARPKTETAEVASPWTHGKVEYVERVTDTLTSMFSRRQLTQLEFSAGDRYRESFQMLTASAGGSMDFEKTRVSSGPRVGQALKYVMAAEVCNDAKLKLYPKDFALVHRVCVVGLTIEQSAKQLFDAKYDGPWPPYLKEAGHKFRTGLGMLADMWWPDSRVPKNKNTGEEIHPMRSMRTERPIVTDSKTVTQSTSVAHATKDKVYRSNNTSTTRKART